MFAQDTSESDFIAYVISSKVPIVAASQHRRWMVETSDGFAQRCLPLMMANQFGWSILNGAGFTAIWDGGIERSAIRIEADDEFAPPAVGSHFGFGVVTWHIPYLFKTPPGVQLWVKGPANEPKDAIAPLEGIVETDWAVATFTMNWKFTRANHSVRFDPGETICVVVPQQIDLVEKLCPKLLSLSEAPAEFQEGYKQFAAMRASFNTDLRVPESVANQKRWQKHYFQGKRPDGSPGHQHRTKIKLAEFDDQAQSVPPQSSVFHPLGH